MSDAMDGFNYTVITTRILLDDTSDVRVSSGRRWVQLLFSKSLLQVILSFEM